MSRSARQKEDENVLVQSADGVLRLAEIATGRYVTTFPLQKSGSCARKYSTFLAKSSLNLTARTVRTGPSSTRYWTATAFSGAAGWTPTTTVFPRLGWTTPSIGAGASGVPYHNFSPSLVHSISRPTSVASFIEWVEIYKLPLYSSRCDNSEPASEFKAQRSFLRISGSLVLFE
jgi:hypothetical protein